MKVKKFEEFVNERSDLYAVVYVDGEQETGTELQSVLKNKNAFKSQVQTLVNNIKSLKKVKSYIAKAKRVEVKMVDTDDKVLDSVDVTDKINENIEIINISESSDDAQKTYTMYSGISMKIWDKVWKNKNLTDRLTNVTDDKSFAFDYSYDFETGIYDDTIVEISNIPLDAFVGYREDDYGDDEDFESMEDMTDIERERIINTKSMFLVSLYKYKDVISTKLIKL